MRRISVPAITSVEEFARKLGIPKFVLTRYVFQADRYYKRFRIKKRSGHGYRPIDAPSKELKGVQRWIMNFILRKVPLHEACTAFRPSCSIVRNAEVHVGHEFVLSCDIADFFPSISVRRVFGVFRSLAYNDEVSFALARLTTYREKLPQGAPSSPDIANIVCWRLDCRLDGLAKKRGWTYTRYADDITVSGNGDVRSELRLVETIVEDEGFGVNRRKVRVIRASGRQTVTGLVVNRVVNLPRYRRHVWRALFHQADLYPLRFRPRAAELEGYTAFLSMVRPNDSDVGRFRDIVQRIRSQ